MEEVIQKPILLSKNIFQKTHFWQNPKPLIIAALVIVLLTLWGIVIHSDTRCQAEPDFNKLHEKYGDNFPVIKFLPTEQYPKKDTSKDIWICPDKSEAIVCDYPVSSQDMGVEKLPTDITHTIEVFNCSKMNKWWYVTLSGMGGKMFGPFEGRP